MANSEITVTIDIDVLKEFEELQKILLESANHILKAAHMLDDMKEAAFKKFDKD